MRIIISSNILIFGLATALSPFREYARSNVKRMECEFQQLSRNSFNNCLAIILYAAETYNSFGRRKLYTSYLFLLIAL